MRRCRLRQTWLASTTSSSSSSANFLPLSAWIARSPVMRRQRRIATRCRGGDLGPTADAAGPFRSHQGRAGGEERIKHNVAADRAVRFTGSPRTSASRTNHRREQDGDVARPNDRSFTHCFRTGPEQQCVLWVDNRLQRAPIVAAAACVNSHSAALKAATASSSFPSEFLGTGALASNFLANARHSRTHRFAVRNPSAPPPNRPKLSQFPGVWNSPTFPPFGASDFSLWSPILGLGRSLNAWSCLVIRAGLTA